ncbi:MAG: aminomethyl-transferring glycine dehydrogenase subunit GcvPA [Alphaproteobacteria bacterium]|nr:aminomethyl-transferring glycine dehydrogenase subunit GcvPA [Alphaproteobacteria bacterium]
MRYLPLTEDDRKQMLSAIGVGSTDDLYADVPKSALDGGNKIDLPDGMTEMEIETFLSEMAAQNTTAGSVPSFLGAGAYRHHIPAVQDYMIQRGEFLTAYTPYQPEVSQGTLQAIYEFQTQVAMITDMEIANASMYDGASACAEAASMACRVTKRKKVLMAGNLHPHYRDTTETFLKFTEFETGGCNPDPKREFGDKTACMECGIPEDTACVIAQNPDVFGIVHDYTNVAKACHDAGALFILATTEPLSLGLIKSPGEIGADIVVGEGLGLAGGLSFGGPGVGLFACNKKHMRQMPGRLIGVTEDVDGKRGWVLTMSTREQHIRREKATSNICTNSGLIALSFSIHISLLGEKGFTDLAKLNHAKTVQLAEKIENLDGVELLNKTFFNEFSIKLNKPANEVVDAMAERGILAGVPASRLYPNNKDMENILLVAVTETSSDEDIEGYAEAIKEVL